MNTWKGFKYFEVEHPFVDSVRVPVFDNDGNLWKLTSHSLMKIKGKEIVEFKNFPSPGQYNSTWGLSACGNHITFMYKSLFNQEGKSRAYNYVGYYNGNELKFFPDSVLTGNSMENSIESVIQTSSDIWIGLDNYYKTYYKISTLRFDKQQERVVNQYEIDAFGQIDTNEVLGLINKNYYLWDIQKDTMTKILPDDDEFLYTSYSDSTKTLYSVGKKSVYIYVNKVLKSYDRTEFNEYYGFYEYNKDLVIFHFSNGIILIDKDKVIKKFYYPEFIEHSEGHENLEYRFDQPWGYKTAFLDNGILILNFRGFERTVNWGEYFYYYIYYSYSNGELKFESFKTAWQNAFFYKTLTGDKYYYHLNYDFNSESINPKVPTGEENPPNTLTIEKNNEPPVVLLLPEQIPYPMAVAADSNYVWTLNYYPNLTPVTIWKMQPDVVYVKGNVFYDANKNGIKDSSEMGVSKYPLIIKPGNIRLYPDINGNYGFGDQIGKIYTLEIPADSLLDYVSSPLPYTLTLSDTNNIGLTLKNPGLDVNPNFSLPWGRCNSAERAHFNLKNTGYGTINKLKLTLIGDPLAVVHSYEAVEERNDTLVFEVSNLKPSENETIDYNITFPGGEHLGKKLKFKIIVDIYENETVVKSISDSIETRIRCSFDPNDKTVTPEGVGQDKLILKNIPLSYLIRFENTGNDTAYTVTVYDTLDPNLDPSTIKILGSSHPLITNVLSGGKVVFHFENIMLPDTTTNKEKAQGFVRFSIEPLKNLADKTVIKNKAGIVFDQNTPVMTNEVYNTLVTKIPEDYLSIKDKKNTISLIYPNPANNHINVRGSVDTSVEVYDFTGKKILYTQSSSINTADWQSGIYIFRILDTNGNVLNTEKVLISK